MGHAISEESFRYSRGGIRQLKFPSYCGILHLPLGGDGGPLKGFLQSTGSFIRLASWQRRHGDVRCSQSSQILYQTPKIPIIRESVKCSIRLAHYSTNAML